MVTGTFLILTLVCILCCACQGQSSKAQKNYALVERDSNNSLTAGGKVISNASTNTLEAPYKTASTEESSLEMSDARSHSTKQSDNEIHHVTNYYPPPPSLYDSPTSNVYGILPTVNQHQTMPNPLYVMSTNSPGRDSLVSEELPLPPPPPPPHGVAPVLEEDDDTCVKGLNPTFKTFLDRTIAVKPMNTHLNSHGVPLSPKYNVLSDGSEGVLLSPKYNVLSDGREGVPLNPKYNVISDGSEHERRGLITSDL